jgi:two-component system, OmpR family, sensor histidine kinase TctE
VPREVAPLIEAINAHTERQRQLSEAQTRFVANASHQLKTPLTVLRAQIGHALMQTDLPSMRAVVSELNASSDATGRIVEQLLALARSEPGRQLDMREVDLPALARDVSFEMLIAARAKGIDLGFESSQAVLVQAEPVLLRELVVNIVHNAVVYTQEGGTVTVSVDRRDGRAVLRVVDNGPGIPAGDRARALERFHRIAESAAPGSGLGLAIAKEICARHGIAIHLMDAPGGGPGLCVELLWPGRAVGV